MLKIILILSVVIVLGGFSFWFFQKNLAQSKPLYTGSIEKLRVGNVGEYTLFNLIAADKGYFREYGLDVDIHEYSSGPASIAGLLAGEVDINVAADFVGVRNIFANPDIRILAEVNQHRVFQLASKKDRGIVNPIGLKGKKVGVTRNSAGEFFLGNFLTFNNLKLEDVTMVDLTPADMITQLNEGKIDAIVVFEPHIFKLKNSLGDNFVSWDVQGGQNINALLYTKEVFIKQHPEIIERYLAALIKAEQYFNSNQEAVKEFLAKKLNYQKEYVDYSWPKFTHAITLDQELLINMENEARWVIKNKLTDKKEVPNYLDIIYFNGLQKVKPESVTVIH